MLKRTFHLNQVILILLHINNRELLHHHQILIKGFFVPLTIAEGGTDDNQGNSGTYDGEITEIGKLYSEELNHPFGTDH